MNKLVKILLEAIPLLIMLALIAIIENDYLLSLFFIIIIGVSFYFKYEKKDYLLLVLGLIIMTVSEFMFISTGVETFNRNSLFGVMPLWLPILWAYAFVAIKHLINILK